MPLRFRTSDGGTVLFVGRRNAIPIDDERVAGEIADELIQLGRTKEGQDRESLVRALLDCCLIRLDEPTRTLDPPQERPLIDPNDPGFDGPQTSTAWIAFVLQNAAGQPVPGRPYTLTRPDGTRVGGRLDAQGFARQESIPSGSCFVEFPGMEADLGGAPAPTTRWHQELAPAPGFDEAEDDDILQMDDEDDELLDDEPDDGESPGEA